MTTPTAKQDRLAAAHCQLRDEMSRHLTRIATKAHVGIAFECPSMGREWLNGCCASTCTLPQNAPGNDPVRCGAERKIQFDYEALSGCQIILCSEEASATEWFDLIELLAETVAEALEVSSREDLLLQELAASWETLSALYETSLDLQSSDNLETVIDRLLDRSVVAGPDVSAILWTLEVDKFHVVSERRCHRLEPRIATEGLLGKARERAAPMVLDGSSAETIHASMEPELADAGPIVLIPVHTRQGFEALLQVWRKTDSPPFESPAVRLLEAIALQATNAIEKDRLHRAALEGERMRQEIAIGASIQQHLLLGEHPQGMAGAEIANYMLPSLEVGGDFYQFIRHSDTCFDAVVGDVMGKGIGPALMGAATKNALLRIIAETKGGCELDRLPQPSEIVTATNQYMSSQLMQLNSFVTMFYARFDLQKNTLTFVDAGHTQTLHYVSETAATCLLHGEDFPLGFTHSEVYKQSSVPLGPGDVVLIYSDGISEATDADGQLFGADRIRLFLQQNFHRSGSDIAAKISDEVTAFHGSRDLEDDLTCLVIKLSGADGTRGVHHMKIAGTLDHLETLRNWVAETLNSIFPAPISENTMFGIQLAVQEAASNIVLHGLVPGSSQEIATELCLEGTVVHIDIIHEGIPFSPENVPSPSFDGSRDHGFGVFLINQLMDEVSYTFTQGQNRIALSKDLSRSEEQC